MEPNTLLAGASIVGRALSAPAAGPSSAFGTQTSPYDAVFDSSGWNVNFGGGSIDSRATKTESDPIGLAGLTSGLSMNWQTVAMIGLGVVAIWAIMRRR